MENKPVIREIVKILASELHARSILCYGSFAMLMNDGKSDIDLLILTDLIPSHEMRQKVYGKIPNAKILALDRKIAGDWDNSWSPANDQIQIDKQFFDIGFNTTSWVNTVIEKLVVKHQITFPEFPFRPYTFLGLLEASEIFYDKDGLIEKCRSRIRPIPMELKKEIIKAFLPVLTENYHDLLDYSERNIGILAFEHLLFRGLDAGIQLLFVINDVYDPASKRTEEFLFKLKKHPPNLEVFIKKILPRFFENKKEVCRFLNEMIHFLQEEAKKIA